MTALNQTVQTSVATSYGLFTAGQVASAMPYTFTSARYDDTSTGNNHPLKFGYGCGRNGVDPSRTGTGYEHTGGGIVSQGIGRDALFTLSADINASVASIAWDNDGTGIDNTGANRVRVGDYLVVGTEILFVTGLGASAITALRGQRGSTAASHTSGASVYKMGGTDNFAGVVFRNITVPSRRNQDEIDAQLNNEIVSVFERGDIVCAFNSAVGADDIGTPVGVIGSGSNQGLFVPNTESTDTILVPDSRIITASEDQGSGLTPRYLAVVRFAG